MNKLTRTTKKNKALELYLAGTSQQEIARRLGVSENTLSTWKKQYQWDSEAGRTTAVRLALAQLGGAVQQQRAHYIRHAQQLLGQAQALLTKDQALHHAFTLVCQQLGQGDLSEEIDATAPPASSAVPSP